MLSGGLEDILISTAGLGHYDAPRSRKKEVLLLVDIRLNCVQHALASCTLKLLSLNKVLNLLGSRTGVYSRDVYEFTISSGVLHFICQRCAWQSQAF